MTDDIEAKVRIWGQQPTGEAHGFLGGRGVSIRIGQQLLRMVKLSNYGNPDTGEIRNRRLVLQTHNRPGPGHDFDLDNPTGEFMVPDGEIDVLRDFLNSVHPEGKYLLVRADSATTELLSLASGNEEAAKTVLAALADDMSPEALATALGATSAGLTGAELAVIGKRRELLREAAEVAAYPASTETDMQRLLGDEHWVFGGQYVGVFERRNTLQLDQHDIPLVRADGSLHIVELKGPHVPRLVRHHRNHAIVGQEVHEATMQAANYIRSADEQGLQVAQNLRYEGVEVDLRRVFATVVIGHRQHVDLPEQVIDQALRTYNASLNRIEVVTYDQLLDAASRALDFTSRDAEPASSPPQPPVPPPPDAVPF